MLRFWSACHIELVSVSEWQVWRKPQGFLFSKKENAFTVKSKMNTTNKIPHQVRNDTSIWWIQNDVLYKLKIQRSNQNICCIKDGSRLYAEIKNEEAQVQSEAYRMKLRKWVVRSNFLIQTWFFGSFFIKKKWTEENPFEQQFLMQTKEVNEFTT